MKHLLLLILLIPNLAFADVSVNLIQRTGMEATDLSNTGTWTGVQINYGSDSYVYMSAETVDVFRLGKAFSYKMAGLGYGMKVPVTDNIKLFGQFGYMRIDNSFGSQRCTPNQCEALFYYLNSVWDAVHNNDIVFHGYAVENRDAWTGSVGVEITKQYGNWNTGFTLAYRSLKIEEMIKGYRDEWNGETFETTQRKNYSSLDFGVIVNYQF